MTDDELWLKHVEEYPQIKTWSAERQKWARKGFLSGLAEGRSEQRKVFAENCKRCPKKQLEKEVEELKKQIEKMKCCQNCEYMDCFGKCRRKIPSPVLYCNKWELVKRDL